MHMMHARHLKSATSSANAKGRSLHGTQAATHAVQTAFLFAGLQCLSALVFLADAWRWEGLHEGHGAQALLRTYR